MFLHFISDLLRSHQLQQEFTRDPQAVMKKAGLSDAHQQALLRGNPAEAVQLIHGELSRLELFSGYWPTTSMTVTSITPNQGSPGDSLPVTIEGDYFPPNANAKLSGPAPEDLNIAVTSVKDPGVPGSSLKGLLVIPKSSSEAPPGDYTVFVWDPDFPDNPASLPLGFHMLSR